MTVDRSDLSYKWFHRLAAFLGKAVTRELYQAAVSLIADGRVLNLTENFVPFADIVGFDE